MRIVTGKQLSRRTVLRGVGAAIALPVLYLVAIGKIRTDVTDRGELGETSDDRAEADDRARVGGRAR